MNENEIKKSNRMSFIKGIVFAFLLFLLINHVRVSFNVHFTRDEQSEIMSKMNEINNIINQKYIGEAEKSDLLDGIYMGLVAGLGDRYAAYFNKSAIESLLEETKGEYAGIGIYVHPDANDNSLTVVGAFEDSPAAKAGIKIGDKLLKVDGVDIVDKDLDEIVGMIKGKPKTKLVLTVFRVSEDRTIDFELTRENIDIPTITHKMIENNVGYIKIDSFDGKTHSQFVKAVDDLRKNQMTKLIIDLRNNPGGTLDSVVKVSDFLLPKGVITYIEDKHGKKDYYYSDEFHLNVPLVVLVNRYTASAAELLSGAIKDYGAGSIVGATTYGKGVVQEVFRLSDNTAIKITVSKYFTPNGICVEGVGVVPDFEISLPKELEYELNIKEDEDTQLQKALEILREK